MFHERMEEEVEGKIERVRDKEREKERGNEHSNEERVRRGGKRRTKYLKDHVTRSEGFGT